jgi:hypothetical protein
MSARTTLFQLLPWQGGVNTALDFSMIPAKQLVQADHAVFSTRSSRKKRDGINFDWDDASNASNSIIAQQDYWFGVSSKTQIRVALSDNKTLYKYNSSGARTSITVDGTTTAWSAAITQASLLTFNNKLLIAVDGTSNKVRTWDGSGSILDLQGTPPEASILQEHIGRVWANDKTNRDRLHYSTTGNEQEWQGVGDSGALDIGIGDGDPEGITAIFPTFQGVLFVAKRTKLYKVVGDAPENFQVILVSSGIGCVSPSIATVDQTDLIYISERGFHSLSATNAYGDFEGAYLSKDIQTTFNNDFTNSRLKYIRTAYISNLNSVAFAVTDESVGTGTNNTIWLYNFEEKAWYRWPDVSCQSLVAIRDADKTRLYLGTNTNRVAKAQNGTNYDISTSGTNTAILFTVKTGLIFPDQSPYTIKGFKNFALFYKPKGPHTITCTLKIDNFESQPLTFSQTGSLDLLGSTFVLGESTLDYSVTMAPYSMSIDGYGRGFQLTIEQSGIQEEVEIQGFAVEYENAGTQQEVTV